MRTLRQLFGDWKRTCEAFDLKPRLLKEQLYICPITKKKLSTNSNASFSHIIPLSLIEEKIRPHNEYLAINLASNQRNLFLEDSKSNSRRGNKITEEIRHLYNEAIVHFHLQDFLEPILEPLPITVNRKEKQRYRNRSR